METKKLPLIIGQPMFWTSKSKTAINEFINVFLLTMLNNLFHVSK